MPGGAVLENIKYGLLLEDWQTGWEEAGVNLPTEDKKLRDVLQEREGTIF